MKIIIYHYIYLGCSKKCKTKETNIGLNIDNSICFDKVKVATHFNNFFSDIAGNLVDKLPPIIGKYGYDFVKKFYQDKVSMLVSDYSFTPVSKEHVLKMLIGLNSYKATGLAGVGLPGGPRPAKRPSGQPEPYYGWPGWPAIIFHKC